MKEEGKVEKEMKVTLIDFGMTTKYSMVKNGKLYHVKEK